MADSDSPPVTTDRTDSGRRLTERRGWVVTGIAWAALAVLAYFASTLDSPAAFFVSLMLLVGAANLRPATHPRTARPRAPGRR